MVYSPTFNIPMLNKEQTGAFDLSKALQSGFDTYYKPKTMAEALLGKQLENKYSAFKATPAYQQAMLNFLQGQGANMWGQANRAPADTALRNAQARAAQQKSDAYSQWMSGTGAPSNTPTNASNNSYEGDGGDYYSQGDDNSGSFTNAIYNPQENNQAGDFQNVSQSAPNNVDVESGNRAYMAERGMAAAIGMKEPATFVDPKTGMAYARLRSGIVPIGKEFGEKDKSIATEVGKAKGQEEASYLGEGPTDRRNLQQLKTALEKVNRGDFDAVLGWRHNIPYGMNTAISDKKIAEFAAIEKLLNTYKIKQQALMAKGQGHITDYGRSLLNATFPDIGGNINAFKGQLNQFVGDLSSDSEQRQLIKKYQGQGASFDEARDKAQEDMDYNNPSIAQSPNQPNNRGDFANTSYNEESNATTQPEEDSQSFLSNAVQQVKKYAPIAGDVTASSLLATPNTYAKAAGGLLAAGIGAYEAQPGKRIQGAIQNVAVDSLPGYAGKLISSVAGKGVAKKTIKATEDLFAKRVKPFEEVVSEADKLGTMKAPQNLSAVKDKLSTALAGHKKNWTSQLHDISSFKNNPIFGNAQKAQSALGQIERADVEEAVRAEARDLRKRILGTMQTHLTTSGNPQLLPKYAEAMKEYAKSGPLLKDLVAKAKDMGPKEYAAYVKSLSNKGGLPTDLSDLSKSIRRRQAVGNAAKGLASAVAPGIPAGAVLGYDKIMNILRGI